MPSLLFFRSRERGGRANPLGAWLKLSRGTHPILLPDVDDAPFHPTPTLNHRFDDDDDDFDPDRLAHYDALACGIVSVQRARLMH